MCEQCRYTFCKKCKEIYHSQTMCRNEYILVQIRIRQEKEREKLEKEKEEARLQYEKIEAEKKSAAEKKKAKESYQQIIIKLSEQNILLEQLLNAERLETLNTQRCPNCNVRIEKNGGCSHMHCSRCDHHFTWEPVTKSQTNDSTTSLINYINTTTPLEALKEDLNKTGNIGLKYKRNANLNFSRI